MSLSPDPKQCLRTHLKAEAQTCNPIATCWKKSEKLLKIYQCINARTDASAVLQLLHRLCWGCSCSQHQLPTAAACKRNLWQREQLAEHALKVTTELDYSQQEQPVHAAAECRKPPCAGPNCCAMPVCHCAAQFACATTIIVTTRSEAPQGQHNV
jgi:hypothetical protein